MLLLEGIEPSSVWEFQVPQIVEGWYGQPWGSPHHWLRDYVSIMRKIFAREEPVTHIGKQLNLPYTADGSINEGKALKPYSSPCR
ncbi:MAG: hypothetical protein CM15mP49_34980 [Actinomycetota bacterium]|nr:MAG: hypothetical protein CM15mP49_34980 [Actinomycetota bacterium]